VAWNVISAWEKRYAEREFANIAADQAFALQSGLKDYLSKMISVRAMFSASDTVTRKEFGIFADMLLQDQIAILGFSWVPRVRRNERVNHEAEAARDGLVDYRIKVAGPDNNLSPSPERDEYYPVFFSNAISKSSIVYGFDMNSEAKRRHVLERARDNDRMATSPRVMLRTGEGDRNGFFVLMPVYEPSQPHQTLEERRQNLIGYINGVFQIGVMFDTILGSATMPLDIFLFGEDAGRDASPMHVLGSPLRKDKVSPRSQAMLAQGQHWSGEILVAMPHGPSSPYLLPAR
jgi:CHASE1-domain containing sensor protein